MTSNTEASTRTPGILLVLNDIEPKMEDEFNRWYQDENLADRLAIPGFWRARRYRSIDGQPNYMALFDCDSIDVLSSPAYKNRQDNPTPWTRKVMQSFRNTQRSACRERWSIGAGVGGAAIVVQCKPVRGRDKDARRFIQDKLGPSLMQTNGLVRMSLWETDKAITNAASAMALRSVPDEFADWVLFIETYDPGKIALALHTQILSGESAKTGLLIGSWMRYQLICERRAE